MFVFKKRNLIIISVFVVTALAFVVCFSALSKKSVDQTSVNKIRIVLDAGHGGIDGGVCGVKTGVKESEINLKVVKSLEKYLISAGMGVTLTRNSDAGLYGMATSNLKKKDMQKRRDIIKSVEPHLVVSIHMNKYSLSTRRGAQVFYKAGDERAKLLASNIQTCFNEMEEAVRECSILTGDYYVLNCTEYPSVIAECGFLSNPEDEALLITKEYQDSIAYNVFKGIVGYLSALSLDL
ncbi:MAG: N-acetylmuramoyl-L-alanine amidase [Clostridia bacterium]|nr:N-acetylmuramoyl-L-alanine amidase [Clostridia bacterium]